MTQQRLTSVDSANPTRYCGTIENITESDHWVFPSTISRTLEVREGDGFYSFTHGEGTNRAQCTEFEVVDDLIPPIRLVQIVAAYASDVAGAVAFETLDGELREAFRRRLGIF